MKRTREGVQKSRKEFDNDPTRFEMRLPSHDSPHVHLCGSSVNNQSSLGSTSLSASSTHQLGVRNQQQQQRQTHKDGSTTGTPVSVSVQPSSSTIKSNSGQLSTPKPSGTSLSQASTSPGGNDPKKQTHDTTILPIKSRQAFNITKVTLPPQFSIPTIIIDKNKSAYALKMEVFDAWTIPTLVLLFLSFNPDIMLPLASLREPVFESTLQLTEDTFYSHSNINAPETLIPTLLRSIVCGRLAETVCRLYLFPSEWHQHQTQFHEIQRPPIYGLEKGPIPELQAIVEDSMVVFNPIKVLISFLGAMVDKYRSLDLPIDQNKLAGILLNDDVTFWLYAGSNLSYTYGLFLWDSSLWGVSDAEWDALVQYMTIITTEIFPNAYERISAIGGSHRNISACDATLNDFIKHVLLFITPCFLYHYRPMNKQLIPQLGPYWVGPYEHYFTAPGCVDGVKALPNILRSCTIEYLENPSKFQGLSSKKTGLPNVNASNIKSKCAKFLAETRFDVKELDGDRNQTLRWKMPYRQYDDNPAPATYLSHCVLSHPPVNDAVYQRISSIFPKTMKKSNVISEYAAKDEKDDPHFTCPQSTTVQGK